MAMPSGCTVGKTVNIRKLISQSIIDYWMDHDYAPTIQEIADHVGRPKATTYWHLRKMQALGEIDWKPNRCRTLEVL